MLHVLLLAALAASPLPPATPSPAPSASPPPTLKVIATVRASTACAEIAAHANSAISSALANDGSLTQTIGALRAVELDGNEIKHRNGLDALGEYAKTINLQALAGDGEIKRLRKLAAATTDPAKKKELIEFANWLGGAMWRQRKIARDLNGFVATMDYYDMSTWDDSQKNMDVALFGNPDPRPVFIGELAPTTQVRTIYGGVQGGPIAPPRQQRPTYDAMAQAAAKDFELRLPAISNDESLAASHVDGVFAGC